MQSRAQLEHTKLSQMVPIYFTSNSYGEQDKAFLDLVSLAECNLKLPLVAGQGSLYTSRWLSSVAARAVDLSDLRHDHIRVRVAIRASNSDSLIFENSVYYSERPIKDYQNRQHDWKQNEKICPRCLAAAGNPIIRLLAICP